VNNGLTLDFIDDDGPFPVQHFCFRVSEAEFDSILQRRLNSRRHVRIAPGSGNLSVSGRHRLGAKG
jgi:hypothetical protein